MPFQILKEGKNGIGSEVLISQLRYLPMSGFGQMPQKKAKRIAVAADGMRAGVEFGGKMPDGFACQGYDTAEVIVRALKAVNGNTQDKDKLVDAIAKVEFDSPRGRFRFDPRTHNVIQPFIYVREVKESSLGLNNVPIDKVADVRDPGTGCTLPA